MTLDSDMEDLRKKFQQLEKKAAQQKALIDDLKEQIKRYYWLYQPRPSDTHIPRDRSESA